jgi:hypothetical protein
MADHMVDLILDSIREFHRICFRDCFQSDETLHKSKYLSAETNLSPLGAQAVHNT